MVVQSSTSSLPATSPAPAAAPVQPPSDPAATDQVTLSQAGPAHPGEDILSQARHHLAAEGGNISELHPAEQKAIFNHFRQAGKGPSVMRQQARAQAEIQKTDGGLERTGKTLDADVRAVRTAASLATCGASEDSISARKDVEQGDPVRAAGHIAKAGLEVLVAGIAVSRAVRPIQAVRGVEAATVASRAVVPALEAVPVGEAAVATAAPAAEGASTACYAGVIGVLAVVHVSGCDNPHPH